MVRGKYIEGCQNASEVEQIRRNVFVEEFGFMEQPMEAADDFRIHAIAYDNEKVAGVGSISFDGERFEISHVAILPEYRNQLYGDFVVRMLVNKAILANAEEIYTKTTESTCDFFATIGFEKREKVEQINDTAIYEMCLPSNKLKTCCNCNGH